MKEPSIETPHDLFSSSARYHAPVFQRLYVWGEMQLDALIEDILSEDKMVPQFLGAIVLKDLGKIKGPASPMSYLIIDGQQRLTTLFMLLAATAELAADAGADDLAEFILNEYLMESRSPAFAGLPKLIPTLQDRTSFWKIFETAFPEENWNFKSEPGDGKVASKIEAQWSRIQIRVRDLVYDDKDRFMRKALESFLEHIQKKLNLIVITLDEQDDANIIFSKLNASGVPLSLADLVRNEVFSKFESSESKKAEKFYESRWHPFELSFSKPADLNSFFPIYAYIAFGGAITKTGAFPELQKKWAKSTPQKIIADIEAYSPLYQALVNGSAVATFGKDLNSMIGRFARMPRTTVTWPYILQLLHAVTKGEDEKKAIECLKIVESFLIRRALAGVEPTGLHAVFKGLWQHARLDSVKLKDKIITRTIKVPSKDELSQKLRDEPVDTRVALPYVLSEFERDHRKQKGYDPITDTVVTIEHIMPKKRNAAWKVAVAKEYDGLVGLIGNLVALSEMQNKAAKDEDWVKKRERFKGSNFFTAQKLAKAQKWDRAAICARTEEIIAWVQKRWPAA